jgi:hypothetical protein
MDRAHRRQLIALVGLTLACRANPSADRAAILLLYENTSRAPPRIDVAPDGHAATLIAHVRVSGTLNGQPVTFTAAWLDLLRKDDQGWHIVVHANTEGP